MLAFIVQSTKYWVHDHELAFGVALMQLAQRVSLTRPQTARIESRRYIDQRLSVLLPVSIDRILPHPRFAVLQYAIS